MTHEELAKKCLVSLVEHVLANHGRSLVGITYEDLARSIGFFSRRGHPQSRLGKVLGRMGHYLKAIQPSWQEIIPDIQGLVVRKQGPNKGIPDDGIKEFWDGYDKLTRSEKENKAFAEWRVIADFGSRWVTVLKQLGLEETQQKGAAIPYRNGGGESFAHNALKEFVKNNPAIVGVDAEAISFKEYALPSLDTLDVLFKTPECWTAVEVKSSVSEHVDGDYERGIYQVVKYSALLQAMRRDPRYFVPRDIRVVLLLQKGLPAALHALRKELQITVIEHVSPC